MLYGFWITSKLMGLDKIIMCGKLLCAGRAPTLGRGWGEKQQLYAASATS